MAADYAVTVVLPDDANGKNPYRQGTVKRELMRWAMEKGEFTKNEFIEAAKELREQGKIASKMPPEVMARAWWNEFYAKYKVFRPLDTE